MPADVEEEEEEVCYLAYAEMEGGRGKGATQITRLWEWKEFNLIKNYKKFWKIIKFWISRDR